MWPPHCPIFGQKLNLNLNLGSGSTYPHKESEKKYKNENKCYIARERLFYILTKKLKKTKKYIKFTEKVQ